MKAVILAVGLALAVTTAADAHAKRSQSAKVEFKREHPCPATGARKGPCRGYVIDHHIALCVGGADRTENMRWMTVEAAKAKDRWECRAGWQERLIDS